LARQSDCQDLVSERLPDIDPIVCTFRQIRRCRILQLAIVRQTVRYVHDHDHDHDHAALMMMLNDVGENWRDYYWYWMVMYQQELKPRWALWRHP
jgi:hypothetical protein